MQLSLFWIDGCDHGYPPTSVRNRSAVRASRGPVACGPSGTDSTSPQVLAAHSSVCAYHRRGSQTLFCRGYLTRESNFLTEDLNTTLSLVADLPLLNSKPQSTFSQQQLSSYHLWTKSSSKQASFRVPSTLNSKPRQTSKRQSLPLLPSLSC